MPFENFGFLSGYWQRLCSITAAHPFFRGAITRYECFLFESGFENMLSGSGTAGARGRSISPSSKQRRIISSFTKSSGASDKYTGAADRAFDIAMSRADAASLEWNMSWSG
ncbi:unknown [Coraliomargarita sp. CAG:312]|nr:unknown [Coraliomargarita sp. CAG:312]